MSRGRHDSSTARILATESPQVLPIPHDMSSKDEIRIAAAKGSARTRLSRASHELDFRLKLFPTAFLDVEPCISVYNNGHEGRGTSVGICLAENVESCKVTAFIDYEHYRMWPI